MIQVNWGLSSPQKIGPSSYSVLFISGTATSSLPSFQARHRQDSKCRCCGGLQLQSPFWTGQRQGQVRGQEARFGNGDGGAIHISPTPLGW